jgi:hypothetical protein
LSKQPARHRFVRLKIRSIQVDLETVTGADQFTASQDQREFLAHP